MLSLFMTENATPAGTKSIDDLKIKCGHNVKIMRMWMVDPKIMCRNHLLGEHAEIHMFVWNIDRKHSVKGYIANGLLETHKLYTRHEELAQELRRRGYQHNSELDVKWKLAKKLVQ
jgi:hypothetical protein